MAYASPSDLKTILHSKRANLRDILRADDENDWHTAEIIRLLTALAALFHDVGKASEAFQKKLKSKKPIADAYRHEWVSLRLFEAFVGGAANDESWIKRLASLKEHPGSLMDEMSGLLVRDDLKEQRPRSPFKILPRPMPPLAQLVGWLVVSHHRLPMQARQRPLNRHVFGDLLANIADEWCGSRFDADAADKAACWNFKALPFDSRHWRQRASRTAQTVLKHPGLVRNGADCLDNPYVIHLSRLALMLADHCYSSQPSHDCYGDTVSKTGQTLYANSRRIDGKLEYKQRLDEHLIGVEINAQRIVRTLPRLAKRLPRIADHPLFRQRSKEERYRWQDRAFDRAESIRQRTETQGFFGVNLASTGCGKTRANGRILYALSDPQRGARFTIALGLRTLTLQTGEVYRNELRLGSEHLAVLVGGGTVRELYELGRKEDSPLGALGAESSDELVERNSVHFDGSLDDGPLNLWLKNSQDAQKLLNAPVLACTIDHLVPATESTRGGHQLAPMLRLMSSDLVLDEPDDFDTDDLPALARLVNWAGMLGSRILLSSATLPPALAEGLFEAYLAGRRIYHANRGIPGQAVNVCCAWIDEFDAVASDHAAPAGFAEAHGRFVGKRLVNLNKEAKREIRRCAEIIPLSISGDDRSRAAICSGLAARLHERLHTLHTEHHSVDPRGGKRVSFGLIRMANIDPLVETAKVLYALGAEAGHRIHLCVYHSQHPLLVRAGIEKRLDRLLNRKQEAAVFADPELRSLLDGSPESDHVFVVLATAVAEVGRDHDYDWGIVEPSSMRSIIQLAGRIRRHRPGNCEHPNLYLLDTNVRHLENPGQAAFCRPGFESFESDDFRLKSHRLHELLTPEQWQVIDASSRIRERPTLQADTNLIDLEHARLRDLMQGQGGKQNPVHLWWKTRAPFCGELQRVQPFRNDPQGRQRFALVPDDNGDIGFYRLENDGERTRVDNLMHEIESLDPGPRIGFSGEPDYALALEALAETLGMETRRCALRYGVIELPAKGCEQGWHFHPALGFSRYS